MNSAAFEREDWAVDGSRGLAALLVMLAHYSHFFALPASLGTLATTGVDWFFVLSGYVFAPALLGRKPLRIKAFFVRRFFRIYPLYAAALLLYAGLRFVSMPPMAEPGLSAEFGQNLLLHIFFLHTLESREIAFYFNPAFWSLPPEVAFYLLVPCLAWAACRQARAHNSTGIWLLWVVLIAVMVRIQISANLPANPATVNIAALLGFHLPGLLCEFLLGSLAWLFVQRQPGVRRRLLCAAVALLMLAGLGWVFSSAAPPEFAHHPFLRGMHGLWAAAAYALLCIALFDWPHPPPRWLHSAALQLGLASYGVYLFHNAAPQLLTPAGFKAHLPAPVFGGLAVLLTVAIALLMHRLWEVPMRRWGRTLAARVAG